MLVDRGGIPGNGFVAQPTWGERGAVFTPVFCVNKTPQLTSRLYFTFKANNDLPGSGPFPTLVPTASLVNVQSYSIADPGAGAGPQANLVVVGILNTGSLCFLNMSTQNWEPLDTARTFLAASATYNAQGLAEVFAIGSDRLLYAIQQHADGSWTPPIQIIAGHQFSFVKAAQDGGGEAFGFGVTTGSHLFRLVKNEALEWEIDEVQYQSTDNLVKVETYTCEIKIRDEQGVLRPNAKVDVWAEDVTPVRINGKSYLLHPTLPTPVAANGAAQLIIVTETKGLATPILKWRTEFMPPGKSHMAEPNWRIQQKLKTIQAAELTSQLGVDATVAAQVAPYINNAMSLIPDKPSALRGAREIGVSEPFPNRIDASVMGENAWRLDFRRNRPVFRVLSKTELEAIKRVAAPMPDLSLSEFFGDLGDLVNSIGEGIATVATLTISGVDNFIRDVLGDDANLQAFRKDNTKPLMASCCGI